ncbi:hypothetical protein PCANB_002225 [Pneumocystis canis]|nr:hypothetical protein PCK1_002356 [Pneumocystis canis]KAG5438895.1 hypothetical protein PCANB_002225 [Pneumocystis canis]
MSTRARAEKGRFIPGSTEFDIIPQKWRQEWVERQISNKDNKIDTNDIEPSESLGKHQEQTSEEISTSFTSTQENI